MGLDAVLEQALALSDDDRQRLVARLIESFGAPSPAPDDDALAETIERRLAEIDAGAVRPIDGREAIARARAELARRRGRG